MKESSKIEVSASEISDTRARGLEGEGVTGALKDAADVDTGVPRSEDRSERRLRAFFMIGVIDAGLPGENAVKPPKCEWGPFQVIRL